MRTKELKVQKYRVERDPNTKEITRKEPLDTCLISEEDVRRNNKMQYGNSISGGSELFFEVIKEKPKKTDK